MDKLAAVNRMLRASGRNPAPALDTGGASDVGQAERVLDEVELQIQSRGWSYNTIRDAVAQPDTNGNITVPSGTIVADSDAEDAHVNVNLIGDFLYNLDEGENTPTWTRPIKIRYILRFEFNCIPPPIRFYIADEAAVEFMDLTGVSGTRLARAQQQLDRSRAGAHRHDNWQGHGNRSVLDTPEARAFRGHRPRTLRGDTAY